MSVDCSPATICSTRFIVLFELLIFEEALQGNGPYNSVNCLLTNSAGIHASYTHMYVFVSLINVTNEWICEAKHEATNLCLYDTRTSRAD